jgi:hypothetical protein
VWATGEDFEPVGEESANENERIYIKAPCHVVRRRFHRFHVKPAVQACLAQKRGYMTDTVPVSEVVPEHLAVFASKYCHAAVHYFDRHSTRVATVEDLCTFIQEQTHPDKDETDIAITLHHSTLPKLADADLLDYDPRSKTARYRGHTGAESA